MNFKTKQFLVIMSDMTAIQSYTTPKVHCFINFASIVNSCLHMFADQSFFLNNKYFYTVGHSNYVYDFSRTTALCCPLVDINQELFNVPIMFSFLGGKTVET